MTSFHCLCRYQLPPESAKTAQPSLDEPRQQWQAVLSQQGPDVPVADCMLRAYQVCLRCRHVIVQPDGNAFTAEGAPLVSQSAQGCCAALAGRSNMIQRRLGDWSVTVAIQGRYWACCTLQSPLPLGDVPP